MVGLGSWLSCWWGYEFCIAGEVVDPLTCEVWSSDNRRVPPVGNGMAHEIELGLDLFLDETRVVVWRRTWRQKGVLV